MEPEGSKHIQKLFNTHREPVRGLLLSLGCDESFAQDIYHDCFIIYMGRIKVEVVRDPGVYLKGIAQKLWADEIDRRLKAGLLTPDYAEYESAESIIDDQLEEWREIFNSCIKRLKKKCFRLLDYERRGYSYEVIGYRLGIDSIKKVSDDRRYCLRKLREFIIEELKKRKNDR